jgi:hypothetical protein
MLQMLSVDVADMCCWVLQILFFNVADVAFQCCGHVVLGVVLRKGEEVPDVECCTQHGSQHGRNMGEERRKTPHIGCFKQSRSQHFHNTFATHSQLLPSSL